MKKLNTAHAILMAFLILLSGCKKEESIFTVQSPNNNISVAFALYDSGQPFYTVQNKNRIIIDTSYMSFDFKDLPSLKDNLTVVKTTTGTADDTWDMPWGEQLTVRNHYNELILNLEEQSESKRLLNVHFKVYDDGIGFRYEFPEQPNLKEVLITDENERTTSLSFDFLEEGKTYVATVYKDAPNAHWNDNPEAYEIEKIELKKDSTLDIKLAPGGGFAISIFQKRS